MEKLVKVIRVLTSTLMTIIIIIGIVFVGLYFAGIEPFVVKSGSMEPQIETGSVSFVNKHIQYEDIKEQDVIAFTVDEGVKVTHRVVEKTEEGLRTKGDANKDIDGTIITKNNYIGKNIFSIPKLGYVVNTIQTPRGRIILITVIVVMLLAGILIGEPTKGRHEKEKTEDE